MTFGLQTQTYFAVWEALWGFAMMFGCRYFHKKCTLPGLLSLSIKEPFHRLNLSCYEHAFFSEPLHFSMFFSRANPASCGDRVILRAEEVNQWWEDASCPWRQIGANPNSAQGSARILMQSPALGIAWASITGVSQECDLGELCC